MRCPAVDVRERSLRFAAARALLVDGARGDLLGAFLARALFALALA